MTWCNVCLREQMAEVEVKVSGGRALSGKRDMHAGVRAA